jgi:hypothetical protein
LSKTFWRLIILHNFEISCAFLVQWLEFFTSSVRKNVLWYERVTRSIRVEGIYLLFWTRGVRRIAFGRQVKTEKRGDGREEGGCSTSVFSWQMVAIFPALSDATLGRDVRSA